MRSTIILNAKQENNLEQILNELIYSLKKTYSDEDLLRLSYQIFKESGKQTYISKKEIAGNLFKTVGTFSGKALSFTKNKYLKYRENGFENEFSKDFNYTISGIEKAPEKIMEFGGKVKVKLIDINDNFLKKTKDEKIELISVSILSILIFFASAGGEDIEGGIPDSDLNLGVGFHRHFMSHSIVIGFLVEFLMRAGIETLNVSYKNLPSGHHSFWDKSNTYINKHKGMAIGSMWAGISAHLLKDSGILGHGVKPYNGVPFEMSMGSHQGLFAANSAASSIIAYHEIKKQEFK